MTENKEKRPTYHISLAVAGAAMGGTYSAGVLDFLLEALSESEKAKDKSDDDAQPWDVRITDLVGTSSGGITAALALSALSLDYEHLRADFDPDKHAAPRNNPLYEFWVIRADAEAFINIDDLKSPAKINHSAYRSVNKGNSNGKYEKQDSQPFLRNNNSPVVRSVVSADAMRIIAEKTFRWQYPIKSAPLFAQDVRLTLTMTNLRGVAYKARVATTATESAHNLTVRAHADHQTFDTGTDDNGNNSFALKIEDSRASPQWGRLVDAMAATSAYPGILAPVLLKAPRAFYNERYVADATWSTDNEEEDEEYFAVDGFFRSKPYDLAEQGLRKHVDLIANADAAKGTVLLIDPFLPGSKEKDQSLKEVATPTLDETLLATWEAAKTQASFKHRLVTRALDSKDFRIFLIAPRSSEPDLTSRNLFNTASVLHERLRIYDFMRGRRDAQRFLRESFVLDAQDASKNSLFNGARTSSNGCVPIIPLCGSAKLDCVEPTLPRVAINSMKNMERLVLRRVRTLINVGARQTGLLQKARWWEIGTHVQNSLRKTALSAAKSAACARAKSILENDLGPFLEEVDEKTCCTG